MTAAPAVDSRGERRLGEMLAEQSAEDPDFRYSFLPLRQSARGICCGGEDGKPTARGEPKLASPCLTNPASCTAHSRSGRDPWSLPTAPPGAPPEDAGLDHKTLAAALEDAAGAIRTHDD
jgi:hypothetical protein